jgi:hypothetical protein
MNNMYQFSEETISEEEFYRRLESVQKEDSETISEFCNNFIRKYQFNRIFFEENKEDIAVYNDDLCNEFVEIAEKFFQDRQIDKAKSFYIMAIELNEFSILLVNYIFKIYMNFKDSEPEFILNCLDIEGWDPEDQGWGKEKIESYDEIAIEFPNIWDGVSGDDDEEIYKMLVKRVKEKLQFVS